MSLTIYKYREDIPEDIKYIKDSNLLFAVTPLSNCSFTKTVLKEIDSADYVNEKVFLGRTKSFGNLFKECLSSGAKTLLNIYHHPEMCFDLCQCGNNALSLLPLLKNGYVLMGDMGIAYGGDSECDIIYNGEHITDFYVFIRKYLER